MINLDVVMRTRSAVARRYNQEKMQTMRFFSRIVCVCTVYRPGVSKLPDVPHHCAGQDQAGGGGDEGDGAWGGPPGSGAGPGVGSCRGLGLDGLGGGEGLLSGIDYL